MQKLSLLFFAILVSICLPGCLEFGENYNGIPPGMWRATLDLTNRAPGNEINPDLIGEEQSEAKLPFLFEVKYINPDSFILIIHNAEERITVSDIQWGKDRATGRDTIRIDFSVLDSHISAQFEEDYIEGTWHQHYRGDDYSVPFRAEHGKAERFSMIADKDSENISGQWESIFSIEQEPGNQDTLLGVFKQDGNNVTGTFLSETGDYRYLEGKISGDRLFLSTFDGGHAYLFESKVLDDGTMSGIFRSGNHYKTYWVASRDSVSSLKDAESLVSINENAIRPAFSLPSPGGKYISPADEQFEGKVLIIQILGTWCVNCLDETRFLQEYLRENSNEDLKILGVAFERYRDSTKAMQVIERYREKLGLEYDIVYGGYSNKQVASDLFPELDRVLAYPTMIFIDRTGRIRKVHTGFSGPATEEYDNYVIDFRKTVEELLSEKAIQ